MKPLKKLRGLCLAMMGLLLVPAFGSNSWAALYSGYVGNRTDGTGTLIDTAGGITATGNSWAATGNSKNNKGVRLDWTADPSGQNWVYTYTFSMASGALKDIQNFDLQVADDFGATDLVAALVTTPATGVTGPTAGTTLPGNISENSGAFAAPNVLNITKGYQWSCSGSGDYTFTLTITSPRAPVWGDFMVYSSEKTATDYLTAYNSGFGAVKVAFPTTGGVYNGQVAVPGGPAPIQTYQTLTVTFAGTGSGNVNNNFQGAPCSGPSCTTPLPTGQQVTLYATADGTSIFSGWSGNCSIDASGNCMVTMDAAREAIATFTAAPLVMGGASPFQNLQSAFDNSTDTIRSLAITYTEGPIFNRPGVALQFIGGFDGSYKADNGVTTIKGSLTIRNGALAVSNVRIQ